MSEADETSLPPAEESFTETNNKPTPPDTLPTDVKQALSDVNTNFAQLTSLVHQFLTARPSYEMPAGQFETPSQQLLSPAVARKRPSLHQTSDAQPPAKQRAILTEDQPDPQYDDTVSVHAFDTESLDGDIQNDPFGSLQFWTTLKADLEVDDKCTDNIDTNLVEILNSRWGKILPAEKLKAILGKYHKPASCKNLYSPKVNPEVWTNLRWDKKQGDLRLFNMQETIQKIACTVVEMTNFIFQQARTLDQTLITEQASKFVDAIALLGHLVSNISSLRRSTIKPLLNPAFQALCSYSTDIPHGPLLLGENLSKQVKKAENSNKILKSFQRSSQQDSNNFYRRDFTWRSPGQFSLRKPQPAAPYRRPTGNFQPRQEKK